MGMTNHEQDHEQEGDRQKRIARVELLERRHQHEHPEGFPMLRLLAETPGTRSVLPREAKARILEDETLSPDEVLQAIKDISIPLDKYLDDQEAQGDAA